VDGTIDKLREWADNSKMEDYICSVTITDANNDLKVLYFPKPNIVKYYWDLP